MAAVVFDEVTDRILEKESDTLLALIFDTSRYDRKSRLRVRIGNSLGFFSTDGSTQKLNSISLIPREGS